MMLKELKLTGRKKLLGAVIICALMISGLMMWYTRPVAEAAVLDPHPGLVGWWRFDEGTGMAIGDSSGSNNNGTLSGANWVMGRHGQALSFDGLGSYVNVPNSVSLDLQDNSVSVFAWINHTSSQSGQRIILDKSWISQYRLQLVENYLGAYILGTQINSPSIIPLNEFHFVGVTYDGANIRLWIDGLNVASTAKTGKMAATGLSIYVGKQLTDVEYFDGIIDEVRIYNRALSAAEIQADFQVGPNVSSNLLARVPKGTTQVITTFSWQGAGSINATIVSPLQSYTEDTVPVYQKTSYSTDVGISNMVNIKRLSVSVNALSSDQNWYVMMTFDNVNVYAITVEVQK